MQKCFPRPKMASHALSKRTPALCRDTRNKWRSGGVFIGETSEWIQINWSGHWWSFVKRSSNVCVLFRVRWSFGVRSDTHVEGVGMYLPIHSTTRQRLFVVRDFKRSQWGHLNHSQWAMIIREGRTNVRDSQWMFGQRRKSKRSKLSIKTFSILLMTCDTTHGPSSFLVLNEIPFMIQIETGLSIVKLLNHRGSKLFNPKIKNYVWW